MDLTSGSARNPRQRALYRVLTAIFLSTLPCYCAGIVTLVAFVPQEGAETTTEPPLFIASATATLTPIFTPTASVTPGGPTLTLFPTPTQFIPPPTNTPTPTLTNTPVPTDTPLPTDTGVPTLTPTETGIPTLTPTATEEDPDTDDDGLPDAWEITHFGDLSQNGSDDLDTDTLANQGEFDAGTDPNDDDTDDDGLIDGDEVFTGTNPLVVDSDGDTLSDGDEVLTYLTNPLEPDTDGGCEDDGSEIANGRNPVDNPADDDPPCSP